MNQNLDMSITDYVTVVFVKTYTVSNGEVKRWSSGWEMVKKATAVVGQFLNSSWIMWYTVHKNKTVHFNNRLRLLLKPS